MADGKVVIKGVFDSSDISRGVETTKSKLASVGSTVGSIAKGATVAIGAAATAGTVAAVGAVSSISQQALSAYSSYEQLVGGVDTLFKDASATVQENAKSAYTSAGMSANDYMETVTSFSASLIQSLGGDTAAAAKQADVAVVDMSDNVNKMGSNIEDVRNAYQGFAKQNYTMLDNLKLGYGGTKEEMERLISDANKLREAQGEAGDLTIDSYSDIVTAIHLVQKEMGIAGTTEEEALTTIEGSVNSAKAAWTNWLTELGKDNADMGARTQELVEAVVTAAQNIIPRMGEILTTLGTAILTYGPSLIQQIIEYIQNEEVLQTLGNAMYSCFSSMLDFGIQMLTPENINGVIEKIANFLSEVADPNTELGGKMAKVGSQIIAGIIQGIVQHGGDILASLLKIVANAAYVATATLLAQFTGKAETIQFTDDGVQTVSVDKNGSIEWHAGGGMFSSPQVIGVGEAGTEYLLNEPQVDAVASRINAQGASIDYNALGVAVANAIANTGFGFYVDSKQLASVTAGAYNAQSGRTQAFEMRWAR